MDAPKEEEGLPPTQNAQLHDAGLPACDVSAYCRTGCWWLSSVDVRCSVNCKQDLDYFLSLERGLTAEKMLLWLLGAALLARAAGFYLPGLAPVSFCEPGNDQVPDCKVNITWHRTAV